MNFFFGQAHKLSIKQAEQSQQNWINNTIFGEYQDCISTHIEPGFALTLVNDPKKLCEQQSKRIHINDQFVCASDCILYNKVELAAQLTISSHSTNEQFIISCFRKWGKLFPDKLDGKFSFVLWDRQSKTLLAGRDAIGYGCFCYSHVDNNFLFASDLATLLDHTAIDKSINNKRFYQCFRYSNNTPEQTYFKYCNYCPPSHVIEHSAKNTIVADYWQLHTKAFKSNQNDAQTNCDIFISLLEQAIENEAPQIQTLGLMLSGGYDSNLLAAILARKDKWKNSLTCYSYTFDKHRSCDESPYIDITVKQLKLNSKKLNGDNHHIFADTFSRPIIKDSINLDGYAALPEMIFSEANQDGIQLMILGHYGDDLFGGNRYKFADLIASRNFKSIIKMIVSANNKRRIISELANFGIRPLLPKSIKTRYRKVVKAVKTGNALSINDNQVNTIEHESRLKICKLFHHQNLLKLIYYTNSSEGVYYYRKHLYLGYNQKYVMPYFSKKMIEFFWNLPLDQLGLPNENRWLQKYALNLLHLDHIANRQSKTDFIELFSSGMKLEKKVIAELIETLKLKDVLELPEDLIKKCHSEQDLDSLDAGIISNYLLTALWWEIIKNTDESYNQLVNIEINNDLLHIKNHPLWTLDSD